MANDINNPGVTIEELAKRLPHDQLERLIEIKRAYPGIPLESLPQDIKRELNEILWAAEKARRNEMRPTGQSKKPLPHPYDQMPESEKLSLVDELLKTPRSPIPQDYPLTKEQKLDLFDELVEGGAIKYKRYGG